MTSINSHTVVDDPTTRDSSTIYDLIANVNHESVAGTTRDKEHTVWKVHLRAGSGENEKWLLIHDLTVEEARKEMIFLGETVLQVYIISAFETFLLLTSISDLGTASIGYADLVYISSYESAS